MKYFKILFLLITTSTLISFNPISAKNQSFAMLAPQTSVVYICNSSGAYAYHTHYCQGLNRCKSSVSQVNISTAKSKGYRECGYCY